MSSGSICGWRRAGLGAVALGLYHLPVDWWTKGYMAMGIIFCVGSAFTLAKTLRDQHEATKLTKKIDDIQTEKILREHALDLNGATNR